MSGLLIDVVCVILWVISSACFLAYMGKPNRYQWFTPLGVFWIFYLLRIQFPSLLVYHRSGWVDMPGMYNYPLIVAVAPLCIIIGAMLGGHRGRGSWVRWWHSPLVIRENAATPGWVLYGVGLLIVALHIVAVRGNVPLFAMFRYSGDPLALLNLRKQASSRLPLWVGYLIVWNREMILPLAVVVGLVVLLTIRKFALFLLVIPAAAMAAMFTLARNPIVWLLVKTAAAYYLVSRRRIGPISIILAVSLVIAFPLAVNLVKQQNMTDAFQAMLGLWDRAVQGTSWTVGAHVEHVPGMTNGFLYGRSIRWYTRITRQRYYPLASAVATMVDPDQGARGGLINTCYVGDIWANFAWPGVILGSLFLGWWFSMLESLILRLPRTPTMIAVAVIATVGVEPLISTGIQVYLVTHGGVFLALLLAYMGAQHRDYGQFPQEYATETDYPLMD